ncbi:hypothetical protein L2E82_39895 [Cichorium intybus]|uniref:Uncharacterized protein n=1 Tax=Cichorium intybus TaxID=13427 RepID=A0ACB9AJI7_CICIN|nr:hypothetical protein L2E82_39895 [Cichorium intybus]
MHQQSTRSSSRATSLPSTVFSDGRRRGLTREERQACSNRFPRPDNGVNDDLDDVLQSTPQSRWNERDAGAMVRKGAAGSTPRSIYVDRYACSSPNPLYTKYTFSKKNKKTSIIMIHLLFVKSNSHSDADVDGLDAILELNECWIGILKDFKEFYQSS